MIAVDGKVYDVAITALDLDTEFIYKYANRMEDMSLAYELGGIFFNQSITFGMGKNGSDMAKLWDLLSSKSEVDNGTGHNVKIWTPIGRLTFLMYPNSVKISLLYDKNNETWWTGMNVKFIGVKPARR